MFATVRNRAEDAFAAFNLQGMSVLAKVAAVIVVAGGIALTVVILVLDFFSENPSSSVGLVFPFMALYITLAVLFIAFLDWGIRQIIRRK